MKTLLIANEKGGCGKTTFATVLAAAIARAGESATLADADPQRAALAWLGRRPSDAAPIRALDWTRGLDARPAAAPIDWLIVDAGPCGAAAPIGRTEAALSDLEAVIAPATPSLFDAQATLRFLTRAENAPPIRAGGAALLIGANRLRGRRRAALDPALRSAAGAEVALTVSDHAHFPNLAARGLTIFDVDEPKAERLRGEWAPLLRRLIGVEAARRAVAAPAPQLEPSRVVETGRSVSFSPHSSCNRSSVACS